MADYILKMLPWLSLDVTVKRSNNYHSNPLP